MSGGETSAAEVYARALFQAAGEDAAVIAEELAELDAAIAAGPDEWAQLTSPQMPQDVQKAALDRWLADARPATRNFLRLLVDNRRILQLREISAEYRKLVQAREQQLDVRITTAVELPDTLRATLEERLSASTGQQVTLHTSVDPSIIGGLVVQHGDTLVDTSLRSRLEQLRLQLSRSGNAPAGGGATPAGSADTTN